MKTFKFIGRKYSTEKSFYSWDTEKKFFYYESIGETEELGTFKFENIIEAEIFFIANYPDYYFGGNIVGVDNKDFSMVAIPDYYETCYRTNDRKYILEKELEQLLKRKKEN